MSLDTAIQNLSADIARRAIEDAIGVVNRAFDGLKGVHRAEPVAPAQPKEPSLRGRIAAEMTASPTASNSEIAARLGVECSNSFVVYAAKVRKRIGLKPRVSTGRVATGRPVAGPPRDPSSKFSRLRVALESNPTATNHEIAAIVGVPYTLTLSSHCYRLRKALGIPSPLRLGRPGATR